MKKILKIDANGFLIFGSDRIIDESEDIPASYTDIPLPTDNAGNQISLYKPQLVDGVWIETITQDELAAIVNLPKEPTTEERLAALEEAMIALTLGDV